jgi:glycosyl transferase family 2
MTADPLPLVTIAIPTYNRASSFLPIALGSALAQSYPRLEVLVSDNASSDDTASFMRQYVGEPRLRYVRHGLNIGANENYNYCLSKARGDYFLLLHDDDVIDADFVAACMRAADYDVREGVIRTGVRVIDGRGASRREIENIVDGPTLTDFYCSWFGGKTCWYLANTLFHTRQLRAEGGFSSPYHLAEDGFAIARLARFRHLDVPSVKASFRVHEGERTMADPSAAVLWAREYLALLDCMCAWVAPADVARLGSQGRRFFARLAYNRAALMDSPAKRLRAAWDVLRLFEYRYWPTHRSRTLRLSRRATAYTRRRAEKFLSGMFGRAAHARADRT